ncbi:hypothetical protein [Cryobacterium sp. GrIS_2_6]|nr:uncharacterized protein YaaW (UPF0174 family) [Cryobacterium psychrotolerans]
MLTAALVSRRSLPEVNGPVAWLLTAVFVVVELACLRLYDDSWHQQNAD